MNAKSFLSALKSKFKSIEDSDMSIELAGMEVQDEGTGTQMGILITIKSTGEQLLFLDITDTVDVVSHTKNQKLDN
jgi:hypothetical protein